MGHTSNPHLELVYLRAMDTSLPIRRHPDAVEAEVDGQRVVMSPRDFGYFGLEGTGAAVWDRLAEPMMLDELVTELAGTYETEPDTVRADVDEFLSALEAAGLLASG